MDANNRDSQVNSEQDINLDLRRYLSLEPSLDSMGDNCLENVNILEHDVDGTNENNEDYKNFDRNLDQESECRIEIYDDEEYEIHSNYRDNIPGVETYYRDYDCVTCMYNYEDEYGSDKESRDSGFGSGKSIGKGSIIIFENQILGTGSSGAVFMGNFGERKVAVKVINILLHNSNIVQKEIAALLACDDHENIVKYFGNEVEERKYAHQITYFLAIELCNFSLREWIENRNECFKQLGDSKDHNISPINTLYEISAGLSHLHQREVPIIHRDLKPDNILIQKMTNGTIRMKLSDFGISHQLDNGKTSATLLTSSGTLGWMAPEVLKMRFNPGQKLVMTKETDIFSLGCIFYYVLTNGDTSVATMPDDLSKYEPVITPENFSDISYNNYAQLVRLMISMEPKHRPPITSIINHHIFWSNEKALQFISEVSNLTSHDEWNRIELWMKENHMKIADPTQSKLAKIFSDSEGWLTDITPDVKKSLTSRASKNVKHYNGNSVRDLVRAIRNLKEHYSQQTEGMKKELGNPPGQYFRYWTEKFPVLLDLLWTSCQSQNISNLQLYYENIDYNFSHILNAS